MRAAVLRTFGSALEVVDMDVPSPSPGEVLVRVMASGVNPLDAKIRRGQAAHAWTVLPAVLGIDMAGVVESVGDGVDEFRRDNEVFGMTGGVGGIEGTLAEFVAVQSGEHVLVHGGAGSVGYVAIRLARARGAHVSATGGPASQTIITAAGATAIDYTATTVAEYVGVHTAGRGFDVVFDTVGGTTLDESFIAVKPYTGRVVSALGWGTHDLAPLSFRSATYSGVFTVAPLLTGEQRERHGRALRSAKLMAECGQLIPRVDDRTFTLANLQEAYGAVENRTTAGKIVVELAAESATPPRKKDS